MLPGGHEVYVLRLQNPPDAVVLSHGDEELVLTLKLFDKGREEIGLERRTHGHPDFLYLAVLGQFSTENLSAGAQCSGHPRSVTAIANAA